MSAVRVVVMFTVGVCAVGSDTDSIGNVCVLALGVGAKGILGVGTVGRWYVTDEAKSDCGVGTVTCIAPVDAVGCRSNVYPGGNLSRLDQALRYIDVVAVGVVSLDIGALLAGAIGVGAMVFVGIGSASRGAVGVGLVLPVYDVGGIGAIAVKACRCWILLGRSTLGWCFRRWCHVYCWYCFCWQRSYQRWIGSAGVERSRHGCHRC